MLLRWCALGAGLVALYAVRRRKAQAQCGRAKRNFQLLFVRRPDPGKPVDSSHFAYVPCDDDEGEEGGEEGGVVVQTLCLSVDPYLRCQFNADTHAEYLNPFALQAPPYGGGVGRVLSSSVPGFEAGDLVESMFGFEWKLVSRFADPAKAGLRKRAPLPPGVSITHALGVLGMPGLTAYFCMVKQGAPRAGDTVVVSASAGACGSLAGQMAALLGARVVGICGGAHKVRHCTQNLGFHAAVNYKAPDFEQQLAAACPDGVDVYFDNVGGVVSEAVLALVNRGARIPVCGQIADYDNEPEEGQVYPPALPAALQARLDELGAERARFLVLWHQADFEAGLAQLQQWFTQGELKAYETVTDGLENAGAAFSMMMQGANIGKAVVRVG